MGHLSTRSRAHCAELIETFQIATPVAAINTSVNQQGINMTKPKKLVVTQLPTAYYQVFNNLAEYFELTTSQFLISLLLGNGLIKGGVENFLPCQEAEDEWVSLLIKRQFELANFN